VWHGWSITLLNIVSAKATLSLCGSNLPLGVLSKLSQPITGVALPGLLRQVGKVYPVKVFKARATVGYYFLQVSILSMVEAAIPHARVYADFSSTRM